MALRLQHRTIIALQQGRKSWRLGESIEARKMLNRSKKLYVCTICGENRKLTADHIKELSEGGKTVLSNLQWLCEGCHDAKTEEYNKKHGIEVFEKKSFDDGG